MSQLSGSYEMEKDKAESKIPTDQKPTFQKGGIPRKIFSEAINKKLPSLET